MDKIYANLDLKSFKKFATGALVLADLGVIYLLYLFKVRVFSLTLTMMKASNTELRNQFTPELQKQFFALMNNAFFTLLILVFLYHIGVYVFWNKGKAVAKAYIKLLVWVGGPCSLLYGFLNLIGETKSAIIAIIIGGLYMFVALGLNYFPDEVHLKKSGR